MEFIVCEPKLELCCCRCCGWCDVLVVWSWKEQRRQFVIVCLAAVFLEMWCSCSLWRSIFEREAEVLSQAKSSFDWHFDWHFNSQFDKGAAVDALQSVDLLVTE